MHPDSHYIKALLDGDDPLIQEIYANHAPILQTWVERNGGRAADAEDVFQDSLLTIARQAARPGWQLTCPFGAYLFLVCKSKWFNELKRRSRTGVTIADPDGLADAEDAVLLAEQTHLEEKKHLLLQQKMEALGPSCQELLRLAWTGKPLEEVAAIMGVTYGYVRKKKSKCIAKLIDSIKNDPTFDKLKSGQF